MPPPADVERTTSTFRNLTSDLRLLISAQRPLVVATLLLVAAFSVPLYELFHFAASSYLYSHILLIPFISAYLFWIGRETDRDRRSEVGEGRSEIKVQKSKISGRSTGINCQAAAVGGRPLTAGLLLATGAATLGAYLVVGRVNATLTLTDRLAWTTLSFLLFFWGVCALFARRARKAEVRSQRSDVDGQWSVVSSRSDGPTTPPPDRPTVPPALDHGPLTTDHGPLPTDIRPLTSEPASRAPHLFPFLFLAFMIPFPAAVEAGIEDFLQHGSAEAASWLFSISGMTFFRDGTAFHLPGFNLEVAPECSGIHSSVVLFITSLVAGHMFLHTTWKRWALALFVIPLALARNGFRVVIIGHLCVYVSPDMIHSYIHRQGGPIFFGLSLIPFTVILYLLWRSDRGRPV